MVCSRIRAQKKEGHEQVWTPGLDSRPIVIFGTGQSNMRRILPSTEVWPDNLSLWNWDRTEAGVGTAFTALDPTLTNVSWAFAREVALRFPNRKVHLINISWGGQAISHWMVDAESPDVFQIILNNLPIALATIDADRIDAMLWWQGESDAGPLRKHYVSNFETVMMRFKAQRWFPRTTPIVVFGISGEAQTGVAAYGYFETNLMACVAADPAQRMYLRTAGFPQEYWDPEAYYLHMFSRGYNMMGKTAARFFLYDRARSTSA